MAIQCRSEKAWTYQIQPHWQRTGSESLNFFIRALHTAHDLIHITFLLASVTASHNAIRSTNRLRRNTGTGNMMAAYGLRPRPKLGFEKAFSEEIFAPQFIYSETNPSKKPQY